MGFPQNVEEGCTETRVSLQESVKSILLISGQHWFIRRTGDAEEKYAEGRNAEDFHPGKSALAGLCTL